MVRTVSLSCAGRDLRCRSFLCSALFLPVCAVESPESLRRRRFAIAAHGVHTFGMSPRGSKLGQTFTPLLTTAASARNVGCHSTAERSTRPLGSRPNVVSFCRRLGGKVQRRLNRIDAVLAIAFLLGLPDSGHSPMSPSGRSRSEWDPLESTCRHASLSIL